MNVKISVFVICAEAIPYLLCYNLYDCNIKGGWGSFFNFTDKDDCLGLFRRASAKIHFLLKK